VGKIHLIGVLENPRRRHPPSGGGRSAVSIENQAGNFVLAKARRSKLSRGDGALPEILLHILGKQVVEYLRPDVGQGCAFLRRAVGAADVIKMKGAQGRNYVLDGTLAVSFEASRRVSENGQSRERWSQEAPRERRHMLGGVLKSRPLACLGLGTPVLLRRRARRKGQRAGDVRVILSGRDSLKKRVLSAEAFIPFKLRLKGVTPLPGQRRAESRRIKQAAQKLKGRLKPLQPEAPQAVVVDRVGRILRDAEVQIRRLCPLVTREIDVANGANSRRAARDDTSAEGTKDAASRNVPACRRRRRRRGSASSGARGDGSGKR